MASNIKDEDEESEVLWSPHDRAAPAPVTGTQSEQEKASPKRVATQAIAFLVQQKLAEDLEGTLAFKHIETCRSTESCPYPYCKGLKHYASCDIPKCSFCVLARLVELQTKLSDVTWRELMETTRNRSEELVKCSEAKKNAEAKDQVAADTAHTKASADYYQACTSVGEHYLFLFGKAKVIPNSTKSSSNVPATVKAQNSAAGVSAPVSAPVTFRPFETRPPSDQAQQHPLPQGFQQQQNSSSSNLSRHHRSTSLPIYTGPPPTAAGGYSAPIMLVQLPVPSGGWLPQMAGPAMVPPPFALNLNPQSQQFQQAFPHQPIFIQPQPQQQQQPSLQQQPQPAKRVSPPTGSEETERFDKLVKVAGDANPMMVSSSTPLQPTAPGTGRSS